MSVRAASARPELLTKSVAAAIGEINPTLALTFQPLDSQLGDTLMRERLLAILSASFGALALLMAAVGLYGVTSYAVNLRRTEIGIRMALGATRGSVIRLVLARVSLLIGAGIVVGLAIGALASRFVATLLYGLEPGDPGTLIASAATLALIGAIAGWLPANRAHASTRRKYCAMPDVPWPSALHEGSRQREVHTGVKGRGETRVRLRPAHRWLIS